MIDTHSHPYLPEFEDGGAAAIRRALYSGVSHIILPNVDEESVGPMMRLHSCFPYHTSMAMGLHPTETLEDWEPVVDRMEALLESGDFVAVGEVGIDLHWTSDNIVWQKLSFRRQLRIASRLSLPVIIHCRDGLDVALECLRAEKPNVPLIFHSFTGSREDVVRIRREFDPMFGINGVVTFKNASEVRDAVKEIGIDRLLLETDAPYLAPVPNRGKRNEPSFLPAICAKVGEVLEIPAGEVSSLTDRNAFETFSINPDGD